MAAPDRRTLSDRIRSESARTWRRSPTRNVPRTRHGSPAQRIPPDPPRRPPFARAAPRRGATAADGVPAADIGGLGGGGGRLNAAAAQGGTAEASSAAESGRTASSYRPAAPVEVPEGAGGRGNRAVGHQGRRHRRE